MSCYHHHLGFGELNNQRSLSDNKTFSILRSCQCPAVRTPTGTWPVLFLSPVVNNSHRVFRALCELFCCLKFSCFLTKSSRILTMQRFPLPQPSGRETFAKSETRRQHFSTRDVDIRALRQHRACGFQGQSGYDEGTRQMEGGVSRA